MLVLSRKKFESICIGDDIRISIQRIGPVSVRIGIEAPKDVKIVREELTEGAHPAVGRSGTRHAGEQIQ